MSRVAQRTLPETCNRKRAYMDLASAERAVSRVGRREGLRLYPYVCDRCRSYHLTRVPQTTLGERIEESPE